MKKMFFFSLFAFLGQISFSARAQDLGPVIDMSVIVNNAGLQSVEMAERKRAGMPDKYSGKSTAKTRSANFSYVPNEALRKKTVNNYVAKLKRYNPAVATTVAQNFAPGKFDYSDLYQQANKSSGLKENDAADVLAVYIILNWMIVNNVKDGNAITVPMARGVPTQTASIMANNQKLSTPGMAAQIGEQLKLNTIILQTGWIQSIKDKTDETYRQKIAANFKSLYHFDIGQMKLTDKGLGKK
ncbi:hypothetical protein GJU39_10790 [Pedobacter petrophilus]|uniref:Uncharacterized protein n=1 Tax=Pedobacter petrophilus TaxID=1908241 RepID=A0A7K0FYA7_9SPHI|nr:hypothetical protein [Pedobacter petrophilus]MRX76578.1 hypothetical protein [Pedobacter petrophilus]